jgi:uncharacterized protein (TIGR03067 family)
MKLSIAALVLMFATTGFAVADEPVSKIDAKTAPLTTETLGVMLTDLALEPRDVSQKKNKEVYGITTDRDGRKFNINISLSTDRTALWFELKVVAIPDSNADVGDAWFRLLAHNNNITPAYFTFNEREKRIYLMMTVANADLTPNRMRKLIDQFDGYVRLTAADWDPKNFRPVPVVPAMSSESIKLLSGLDGVWDVVGEEIKGQVSNPEQVKDAGITYTFSKGAVVMKPVNAAPIDAGVWIEPKGGTMTFDLYFPKARVIQRGIAKVEGDTLTICMAYPNVDRPTEFKTTAEFKGAIYTLKRKSK